MKTVVVNIHHEEYDEYCGRPGKGQQSILGNPYKTDDTGSRSESIRLFGIYFMNRMSNDPSFAKYVYSLKGKRLGCFCKPKSCHLDIVAEFLNSGQVLI